MDNSKPDAELAKYVGELREYLTQNGATLMDESNDPSVTVDYYTTDDHVSQPKMKPYTEQFWAKEGALIEQLAQKPAAGENL